VLEAFRDLLVSVESEPGLAAFSPAARELYRQVRLLQGGERKIDNFSTRGPIQIKDDVPALPNREAAELLLRGIARLPGVIPGEDDPSFIRAYATILRNMTVSMMHAIFKQYPEIVPKQAALT
jgi:hypothetical protein